MTRIYNRNNVARTTRARPLSGKLNLASRSLSLIIVLLYKKENTILQYFERRSKYTANIFHAICTSRALILCSVFSDLNKVAIITRQLYFKGRVSWFGTCIKLSMKILLLACYQCDLFKNPTEM